MLCLLQVGLLVATLQLDVSLLMQAFDLGFCDAFMPSEVYEECEAAAKHAAAEKVCCRHTGSADSSDAMSIRTAACRSKRWELELENWGSKSCRRCV